ncbi:MAG TPA: ABC transporter permease [Actinomycetota bacterium]|nr:ABC transporter permease [Actinomycetota bacterium]
MGRYIIRRLLWIFLVLAVVSGITFVIFVVMPPVNPAVLAAGRNPTPQLIKQIEHIYGLDRPRYIQYFDYMKHLFLGDKYGWPGFGANFQNFTSVKAEIYGRMPVTVSLALGAAVVWLLMGIPIGIISGLRRRSLADRASMLFALFGVSMPVFWLGLLMLYLFWFKLHLACGSGYVPIFADPHNPAAPHGLVSWACHMTMPWFALAFLYAAWYARMVRGNILETMTEDYIRTARAKGLPERVVIFKHGMRGALTPVVTMFGMDLGFLLGGAILTERVFNMQGIGLYAYRAIVTANLPAIQGTTLLTAFFIVFANLMVDIVYAYLDPRVRYT